MRFAFRDIPDPSGVAARPRPIVDVVVGGLELAPQACLIDSGATAIRMGMHVAELAGLDLSGSPTQVLAVGGGRVDAWMSEVSLEVGDDAERYRWEAPVWFCQPWTPAFGLLGLTGFFDQFVVTIASYEERFDLDPIS